MDLSYAQNLEDYHLAQAFAGQAEGFYVDVGGGHPVADNVSFWFYLQGWRGLVVEPQAQLAELYRHLRPRDALACLVVGERIGEATFHAVERLHGFSTTIAAAAQAARDLGERVTSHRLPMTTLAALFDAHGVERIDFLKIDVEGAEAQVLAGADWRRWRPRILLVEALAPGSMAAAWDAWEPTLLRHGYRPALFDGLNRFYVAEEERELAERLPKAPAPWETVPHLYAFGRAPERVDHPDHALSRRLVEGFLAELPRLDRAFVAALIAPRGATDSPARPPEDEAFAAALGRIATAYDGGLPLD